MNVLKEFENWAIDVKAVVLPLLGEGGEWKKVI